jgi:L-rhamnose mutarotase
VTVERGCFYLRILPGMEAEFDRRHLEIWPNVGAGIRASGLRNVSGFRRGTNVWFYLEGEPAAVSAFGQRPGALGEPWFHELRDVVAEPGGLLRYDKIFFIAGRPLDGPFTRALFGLVIDPERATDYEALHGNPWPDVVEAIEASGVVNYTGFRRGAHVVYCGAFYPDKTAVFERLGTFEASARWGTALDGVITTITDSEGRHIDADELFHQD